MQILRHCHVFYIVRKHTATKLRTFQGVITAPDVDPVCTVSGHVLQMVQLLECGIF